MPESLCTLEQVRARLALPADTEQDAELDAIREAVEETILDLTGFTFAVAQYTEQHPDVQLGMSRTMRYRPILPMSTDPLRAVVLRARSLASSTFDSIVGDIRDPYVGKIVPLSSELTPVFPPIGGLAPWFRWREMTWPFVEFTYKVDPLGSGTNPVPNALKRAAIEWTAAIYSTPSGGAVASYSAEKVSETFNDASTPRAVRLFLARYIRETAIIV